MVGGGLADFGVVQPPRNPHPIGVLKERLQNEIVKVVLGVEGSFKRVQKRGARGWGAQQIALHAVEAARISGQGALWVEQGDFVHRHVKLPRNVMLVGFFAGCIQSPVFAIEVQFEGAPCRAQTMRFQGKIRQEGVLHFGGPHMLSTVADVEVVEGC